VKARDLLPFPYGVGFATECGSAAASPSQAEILREFPAFTKNPLNRVASAAQHTEGVEGYVFDGADGSQMAFWTCHRDAETAEHVHGFDEYFVVVAGSYLLTLDGQEVLVDAGQECHIPRGTRIPGKAAADTRTIHVFGGHRAERAACPPGAATEPD
jgi:quercetin dioxygenase-like cupin family protein